MKEKEILQIISKELIKEKEYAKGGIIPFDSIRCIPRLNYKYKSVIDWNCLV